ncbi:phosphonate C-P lyase system protein PhnG [Sphingomonas sp. GlSt437]|uniref:phosphonate C-P lyase system protein PhnG n=1 Tax=Sphingomonas sp. GlSt437 TaxID=3389970 RepID=UPI003A8AC18F
MTPSSADKALIARRQRWVSVLAKTDPASLQQLVEAFGLAPTYERLRGPETGLIMLQGRAGGTGAAFNLGEMTVTRCSVRLSDGTLGHSYVRGSDVAHSEVAAWLDALLQSPIHHEALSAAIIEPLAREADERRALAARKTAATRVDFFTLASEVR